jgi:acid phosphatase class B
MKNVAFDFDGVIHTEVTMTDRNGQRHPIKGLYYIPKTPFNKIINLIKIYYENKYNIYIITSRNSNSKNILIQTLYNFKIYNLIKNIYFTGDTHNGDKTVLLDELNINDFYDDSIYHLKSVINEKRKNKLRNLNRFYLTLPEKNDIFRIKFNI